MAEAIPADGRKVGAFLGLTLALGALLLWIAFDTQQGNDRLIGLVGAGAALYALFHFGPLLGRGPLVEAGVDGLVLHSGLAKSRIPWAEIEYVAATRYQVVFWRLPILVVRIRDPRSAGLALARRQKRSARRRGVVTHSLLFSSLGTEEVLALVERHARPAFERSEDGQAIIRP